MDSFKHSTKKHKPKVMRIKQVFGIKHKIMRTRLAA